MFFTKFSIRIQRIHNFQAVAAKPAKSLNCKLQLPCRDNVVNTKNDKMKNLFKYRTTQTKEISLWFMRLILSYNKFKNCAQNICFKNSEQI